MEEKCLCEPTEILIFPCSGGSNVGQIANQAGVKLTQDGMGRFFCLAGIGGHVSGMIESTKAGKVLVAIDGWPVLRRPLSMPVLTSTNTFKSLIWALKKVTISI